MRLKRYVLPGVAVLAWSRLLSDDQKEQVRTSIRKSIPDTVGPLVVKERTTSRRRSFAVFAVGTLVGWLVAYFFDPDKGRGRRAKTRDMTSARMRRSSDSARKMRVRAENKAQGVRAEMRPRVGEADFNDPTLAQKIQSEVLRGPDFPKGKVNVNVENGRVVLRGELDRPEQIKALEAAVAAVPGVREVENLTHLPGSTR
jgi:hypothetical protein